MSNRSAEGIPEARLSFPVCLACSAVQYPPREVCVNCLSDELEWRPVGNTGEVLATTVLHTTLEEKFSAQLPLHVASVKLDAGPVAIVFGAPELTAGQKMSVVNRKTKEHGVLLFAVAIK